MPTTTGRSRSSPTRNHDNIAEDHSGATVFLARNDWQLEHATDGFDGVELLDVVQPHASASDAG